MNINPDVRASGMDDACVAEANNLPVSAFTNPARINGVDRVMVSITRLSLPLDVMYNYVSFGMPAMYGNLGISVAYLDYGDIVGYDTLTSRTQIEPCSDTMVMFSYGFPIKKTIPTKVEYAALGANIKFLHSALSYYASEAFAVDLGGIWHVPWVENLDAGLAIKNFGSDMRFISESVALPLTYSLGAVYRMPEHKKLKLVCDISSPKGGYFNYSLGASFVPVYFLNLRVGYRQIPNSLASGVRAGFGVEAGDFALDYAFTPFDSFNALHSIGIHLAFGNITGVESASQYYLRKHFNKAVEYYNDRDYIEARQQFEEILSVYPDHADSRAYLEDIMSKLDRDDLARMKKINFYLDKAREAAEMQDYVTAKRYYNFVLTMSPDNEQARIGIEAIWKNLQQVERQVYLLENRAQIEELWKEGTFYFQKGDVVSARGYFTQILEIDPTNEDAKNMIVECDNQLSKIAAGQVNDLYDKGISFYKRGMFREAVKYFDAVVLASPGRYDAKEYAAKCRQYMAEEEERQRTEQLIREQGLVQNEMDSTYDKALSYYEKGNFEMALEYFEKSKRLAERYRFEQYHQSISNYIENSKMLLSEKHFRKGQEYQRKEDYDKSAEEYRRALEYNPGNASARIEYEKMSGDLAQKYYEMGMNHFARSEMEEAREYLIKCLQFDPTRTEAQKVLDRIK
ncbi:MAG: PorV/PorQ family protein [Endomicrobiales bacterium]|nr:PorV/PorQ family protein [Endomicrobiales bacterium]